MNISKHLFPSALHSDILRTQRTCTSDSDWSVYLLSSFDVQHLLYTPALQSWPLLALFWPTHCFPINWIFKQFNRFEYFGSCFLIYEYEYEYVYVFNSLQLVTEMSKQKNALWIAALWKPIRKLLYFNAVQNIPLVLMLSFN